MNECASFDRVMPWGETNDRFVLYIYLFNEKKKKIFYLIKVKYGPVIFNKKKKKTIKRSNNPTDYVGNCHVVFTHRLIVYHSALIRGLVLRT